MGGDGETDGILAICMQKPVVPWERRFTMMPLMLCQAEFAPLLLPLPL